MMPIRNSQLAGPQSAYRIAHCPATLIDVWTLRNGTRVTLRPVLPQDHGVLGKMIRRLSQATRLARLRREWRLSLTPALLQAAIALSCVLVVGTAGAQALAAPADETVFAAAQAAYEASHWVEAHAAFAALADQGDAESARIALQMWRHGQALYGRGFEVTPEQARHWRLLLNCRAEDARTNCVLISRKP